MSSPLLDDSRPSEMVSSIVRISMYWVATHLLLLNSEDHVVAGAWLKVACLFILSSLAITTLAYGSALSQAKLAGFSTRIGAVDGNRWSLSLLMLLTAAMEFLSVLYLARALNQLLF